MYKQFDKHINETKGLIKKNIFILAISIKNSAVISLMNKLINFKLKKNKQSEYRIYTYCTSNVVGTA